MFNTFFGDHAGITALMFWGLWAPLLLGLGSWHKYHHLKKIEEIKEKANTVDEKDLYSDAEDS